MGVSSVPCDIGFMPGVIMYEGCTYKSRVSQVWASGLAGIALSGVREGEDATLWRDAKVMAKVMAVLCSWQGWG